MRRESHVRICEGLRGSFRGLPDRLRAARYWRDNIDPYIRISQIYGINGRSDKPLSNSYVL